MRPRTACLCSSLTFGMAEVCQPGTVADHAGRSHASSVRVMTAAAAGVVALVGVMALAHSHSLQSSHPVGDVSHSGPRPPSSADQQILAGVGLGPSDVEPGYV